MGRGISSVSDGMCAFTDGCKRATGRTGYGVIIRTAAGNLVQSKGPLGTAASPFQAKVYAIGWAAQLLVDLEELPDRVSIVSNSKGALCSLVNQTIS